MKFAAGRPYSDPEKAARKIVEIANARGRAGRPDPHRVDQRAVPVREKATPDEYKAGLDLAIERGWLVLHESGTFVRFTQGSAELFA